MTADELKEDLTARAEEMGLDVDQFVEDMESQEVVDKIAKGAEAMFAAGVSSTPTVLANGRPLGDWRGNYLSNIIEVMKAEEQMAGECPPNGSLTRPRPTPPPSKPKTATWSSSFMPTLLLWQSTPSSTWRAAASMMALPFTASITHSWRRLAIPPEPVGLAQATNIVKRSA